MYRKHSTAQSALHNKAAPRSSWHFQVASCAISYTSCICFTCSIMINSFFSRHLACDLSPLPEHGCRRVPAPNRSLVYKYDYPILQIDQCTQADDSYKYCTLMREFLATGLCYELSHLPL
ncbi:unnamed protein product, partial [Laminaria digitata]